MNLILFLGFVGVLAINLPQTVMGQLVGGCLVGLVLFLSLRKKTASPAANAANAFGQSLGSDDDDLMDDTRRSDETYYDSHERDAEFYEAGLLQDECNERNDEWHEERQHSH